MAVFPLSDDNAHMWRYINLTGLIVTLVANFLSNEGVFGETNAEVSDNNPLYIMPNGWAFAIWGIIYTLQLLIHLWGPACGLQSVETQSTIFGPRVFGYWYTLLNVSNTVWCIIFAQDTAASMWVTTVIISMGMLLSLLIIHKRIRVAISESNMLTQNSNRSGFDIVSIMFLWLGISIYAGWVTAATILNVTLSFNKTVDGGVNTPGVNGEGWSIGVVIFAGLVYPAVAYMRRDPIYTLVGAWATLAIADKSRTYPSTEITDKAMFALSATLATLSALHILWGCCHGGIRGYFFSFNNEQTLTESKYQRLCGGPDDVAEDGKPNTQIVV